MPDQLPSKPVQPKLSNPKTMSFGDHLEDLRRRVVFGLLGILPIFIGCVVFGETLLELLLAPARRQLLRAGQAATLQTTGPLEAFGAYFRVATILSLVVGVPWLIYQLWLFVAPGLYDHEKRFAQLLAPLSALMSLIGVLFLYFVMLPAVLSFLIGFGAGLAAPHVTTAPVPAGVVLPMVPLLEHDPSSPEVGQHWYNSTLHELRLAVPRSDGTVEVVGTSLNRSTGILQLYRVREYVGMVFGMGLAFVLGFQLPVVALLLGWVGIVDRPWMVRNRKYAIFGCAIAAAILTPSPDPMSMLLLAVPLVLLYELAIVLMRLVPADRVAAGTWWSRRGRREAHDAGDA